MMFRVITVIAVAAALTVGAATETATAQPLHHPSAPPQVNGEQLAAALLSPSAWGQGYVNDSGLNTGKKLLHKKATVVASLSCGYYEDETFVGNFGNTAGALEDFSNPNWRQMWPFTLQFGAQSLMQFPTAADAAGYLSAAQAKFKSCKSFTASNSGDVNPGGGTFSFTTVSVTPTTVGGYRAFSAAAVVSRSEQIGYTWYFDSLFVQAGTDVFNISEAAGTADAPSTSITSQLIQRVLAAQHQ
jgi:hypothetical protein